MQTAPTMARQAQNYFAAATSSALLVAVLVAAFVVLTMTSSLRSFPIELSNLPIPTFGGTDTDAAAPSSDAPARSGADDRRRGLSASFGVDLPGGRSPAGPGRTRPDRSSAVSPSTPALAPSTAGVGVGVGVADSPAVASSPAGDGGSSAEPSAETSFDPEAVATLPVEPPTVVDPPVAPGNGGGTETQPPERTADLTPDPGAGTETAARVLDAVGAAAAIS